MNQRDLSYDQNQDSDIQEHTNQQTIDRSEQVRGDIVLLCDSEMLWGR